MEQVGGLPSVHSSHSLLLPVHFDRWFTSGHRHGVALCVHWYTSKRVQTQANLQQHLRGQASGCKER